MVPPSADRPPRPWRVWLTLAGAALAVAALAGWAVLAWLPRGLEAWGAGVVRRSTGAQSASLRVEAVGWESTEARALAARWPYAAVRAESARVTYNPLGLSLEAVEVGPAEAELNLAAAAAHLVANPPGDGWPRAGLPLGRALLPDLRLTFTGPGALRRLSGAAELVRQPDGTHRLATHWQSDPAEGSDFTLTLRADFDFPAGAGALRWTAGGRQALGLAALAGSTLPAPLRALRWEAPWTAEGSAALADGKLARWTVTAETGELRLPLADGELRLERVVAGAGGTGPRPDRAFAGGAGEWSAPGATVRWHHGLLGWEAPPEGRPPVLTVEAAGTAQAAAGALAASFELTGRADPAAGTARADVLLPTLRLGPLSAAGLEAEVSGGPDGGELRLRDTALTGPLRLELGGALPDGFAGARLRRRPDGWEADARAVARLAVDAPIRLRARANLVLDGQQSEADGWRLALRADNAIPFVDTEAHWPLELAAAGVTAEVPLRAALTATLGPDGLTAEFSADTSADFALRWDGRDFELRGLQVEAAARALDLSPLVGARPVSGWPALAQALGATARLTLARVRQAALGLSARNLAATLAPGAAGASPGGLLSAEELRLNALRLFATELRWSLDGPALQAEGGAEFSNESLPVRLTARADLSGGEFAGALDFDLPETALQGSYLAESVLGEEVAGGVALAGIFTAGGRVEVGPGGVRSSGQIAFRDGVIAFENVGLELTGANVEVALSDLLSPTTADTQRFVASGGSWGTLKFGTLSIVWRLRAGRFLDVQTVSAQVLGGRVTARPFTVDAEEPEWPLVLTFEGIDAGEFAKLLPELPFALAGQADGTLPLRVRGTATYVSPGRLTLRPGARILFTKAGWLTGQAPADPIQRKLFEQIESSTTYLTSDNLTFHFYRDRQSAPIVLTGNARSDSTRHPLELQLDTNINADLSTILQTAVRLGEEQTPARPPR